MLLAITGIQHIGETLEQFYNQQVNDAGNELGDSAVFLSIQIK